MVIWGYDNRVYVWGYIGIVEKNMETTAPNWSAGCGTGGLGRVSKRAKNGYILPKP